jgi:hypothetical protein
MSPPCPFVKHVNTTYCGFLLGHSQDVDICASLWKSRVDELVTSRAHFKGVAVHLRCFAATVDNLRVALLVRLVRERRLAGGRPSIGLPAQAEIGRVLFFSRRARKKEAVLLSIRYRASEMPRLLELEAIGILRFLRTSSGKSEQDGKRASAVCRGVPTARSAEPQAQPPCRQGSLRTEGSSCGWRPRPAR